MTSLRVKNQKIWNFVVISKDDKEIYEFIKCNNFNYLKNSFGGYKIKDNSITVDILNVKSLDECFQYNIDGLVYGIKNKQIISFVFLDALNIGKIKRHNCVAIFIN